MTSAPGFTVPGNGRGNEPNAYACHRIYFENKAMNRIKVNYYNKL